jgi:glycogen(starch) synthase
MTKTHREADPLRILLYSKSFYPTIGGLERTAETLASALTSLGSSVVVFTESMLQEAPELPAPFRIVRSRSLLAFWRLLRVADAVHVNGFALRPLLLSAARRKAVVVKHAGFQAVCLEGTCLHHATRCEGRISLCVKASLRTKGLGWTLAQLPRLLIRRFAVHLPAFNVAVSAWLAARIRTPRTVVIWNPVSGAGRERGLAKHPPGHLSFFGRLVPEKGVDVLLRAVKTLRERNLPMSLDIVGDGPERPTLEDLARELGVSAHVRFCGPLSGAALAEAQAKAWTVVVPSTYEEPMGIVAVEGMASGAALVVSRDGGLAEVSTGGAITFANGEAVDLARAIGELMADMALWNRLASHGPVRARQFDPAVVGRRYLALYRSAAGLPEHGAAAVPRSAGSETHA